MAFQFFSLAEQDILYRNSNHNPHVFPYPVLSLINHLFADQLVVTKHPHLSYSKFGERPDVIPVSSFLPCLYPHTHEFCAAGRPPSAPKK